MSQVELYILSRCISSDNTDHRFSALGIWLACFFIVRYNCNLLNCSQYQSSKPVSHTYEVGTLPLSHIPNLGPCINKPKLDIEDLSIGNKRAEVLRTWEQGVI